MNSINNDIEPFTVQELINIEVSETIHKPDDIELIDYQISRYETKLKEIEGIKAGLSKDIDFVLSRIGALKDRLESLNVLSDEAAVVYCRWQSVPVPAIDYKAGCSGKLVRYFGGDYCHLCGKNVKLCLEATAE